MKRESEKNATLNEKSCVRDEAMEVTELESCKSGAAHCFSLSRVTCERSVDMKDFCSWMLLLGIRNFLSNSLVHNYSEQATANIPNTDFTQAHVTDTQSLKNEGNIGLMTHAQLVTFDETFFNIFSWCNFCHKLFEINT